MKKKTPILVALNPSDNTQSTLSQHSVNTQSSFSHGWTNEESTKPRRKDRRMYGWTDECRNGIMGGQTIGHMDGRTNENHERQGRKHIQTNEGMDVRMDRWKDG